METHAKGMCNTSLCGEKYSEGETEMTKNYEDIEIEIVFFCNDDVVRTSDNVEDLPTFPEGLPNNFQP